MLTTQQLFRVQTLWVCVCLCAGCAGSTVVEETAAEDTDVKSRVDAATDTDALHGDVAVAPVCEAGAELVPGFSFAPAGSFVMGDPRKHEMVGFSWPAREVELTRSFIIQRTEVTQAQWLAVMGSNPAHFQQCGESCPVESVTFYEALQYCNALSQKEGLETCYDLSRWTHDSYGQVVYRDLSVSLDCAGYRLPTDAEWEYAARAGVDTLVPTGDDFPALSDSRENRGLATPVDAETFAALDAISWYHGNFSATYEGCYASTVDDSEYCIGPQPVAEKAPNNWGLYDVLGNVREWVWDRDPSRRAVGYPALDGLDDYEFFGDTLDPLGPGPRPDGRLADRVLRGSCIGDGFYDNHVARRSGTHPLESNDALGFRVARTFQCDDASTTGDGE